MRLSPLAPKVAKGSPSLVTVQVGPILGVMREPPDCVVLCELFSSPRGNVSVGRLIQGGRPALLREVPNPAPPALEGAVEIARGVAHPKLLKVLGLATDGHRRFIASEYIPGVSLLELNAAIRRRQRGMDAAAAVRVTLGALARVAETGELLVSRGVPPVRLLHADCVWIAEFGETMLTETLVSSRLGLASARALAQEIEAEDVRAAAVELFQLTSARLMTGDIEAAVKRHLPAALASVVGAVFAWDPSSDFDTARGFARALRGLPTALVGSEQAVVDELQRLVPDLFAERRRQLASPEGPLRDIEGPTRMYAVLDAERARADAYESEEETAGLPGQARGLSLKPVEPTPSELASSVLASEEPAPALARVLAAPADQQHRSSKAEWSTLERTLLVVLLALLAAVVAVALQHPERMAALLKGFRAR